MAANQALIQGEYAAAPKFVDVQGAFMSGFQPTFEKIQAEQAVKKEKEELLKKDQAADIRTVNQFNLELVKNPSLKSIGQGLRQEALDLIKNKADMDPVEYETQYGAIINKIDDLSQTFDKVTEFKSQYQEMQQQIASGDIQLSALDDIDNAKYASAIYNNEAQFEVDPSTGELMILVDGLESRPLSKLQPNKIADVKTFNAYTQTLGKFVEDQVTKNGSYVSGIKDAVTRFVSSNNLPAEKIKGMLVDQFGATIAEVDGLEKDKLIGLLINKTETAINEDKQGFAGVTTNIEYAQKQAIAAGQPKPTKDSITKENVSRDIQRWRRENKFGDAADFGSETLESIGADNFIKELSKYRLTATPRYNEDEDEIIGYDIQNPNIDKRFAQTIYLNSKLSDINAQIETAIGGGMYGVAIQPPHRSK